MTITTYPTDDQIELVRLRKQLAELAHDVDRLEARLDDDHPLAVEVAALRDELEASLRRLEALDHLSDDGSAGGGIIH